MGKKELERYSRQLHIPEWGEAQQKKLHTSRVTVVGAGGLGSPVLSYLTAAGVGHLHIVDNDSVSLSNLNRQVLYTEQDIGSDKAKRAAEKLSSLNSEVNISGKTAKLNAENAKTLLADSDVLVDCLDNYAARFIMNKFAVFHQVPLIHAGIHGFNGQLTTILPGTTPCLQCIFAGFQEESRGGSDQKPPTPALGAVVGIIGGLQALEAIKIITGIGELFTHRLLIFDGINGTFDEMEIKRDENCEICGRE